MLVRDQANRVIVSLPAGPNGDRVWRTERDDGSDPQPFGHLTALGEGRYQFAGQRADTAPMTGREGNEADLLTDIVRSVGGGFPVGPVVL